MRIIEEHFPALEPQQLQSLARYAELLADWNTRINLISRKDTENILPNHLLNALALSYLLTPTPGTQILDIGSGGGIPGLVLGIIWPQAKITLLDSIGKKVNALEEMAGQLRLKNVRCVKGRAERHNKKYDFVTGRAVTRLSKLWPLVQPLIHCHNRNSLRNGLFYLTGGDQTEEIKASGAPRHKLYPLREKLSPPYYETKLVVYLSNCR